MTETDFAFDDRAFSIVDEIGRHIPGGFFIYEAEEPGFLLYANKAVLDIYGCDGMSEFNELTGSTFAGMVHPDDYAAVVASIDRQIDSQDGGLDHLEYRIVRKDGAVRWVDDYGRFIESESHGGIYYVFISDITEKRMQMDSDAAVRQAVVEALGESYHTVWLIKDVKSESFSLYRGDTEGATLHGLPIKEALESMKYSQAKEHYIQTTVAPEDQERLRREVSLENIAKRLEESPHFGTNYLRVMENGEMRYYRIEFAKVNMPDGKTGVVCGFKDIDAEVRDAAARNRALSEALETAEQANKAKTAFLSNMSHEVRTPLNAIVSLSSLALEDASLSATTRGRLEQISDSALHLLELVNDILNMSRIESGQLLLREEEFSPGDMLERLGSAYAAQCRDKGLEFECRIEELDDERYIGDAAKLEQVLASILSNALKFTEAPGRVVFDARRTASFAGQTTFKFSVEDTGIGMDESFVPKVFETFAQESSGRDTRFDSAGLGMAITKNIVDMMNGSIAVDSEKGVGTEFTVTVTLKNCEREADGTDSGSVKGRAQLEGRHVLLAEDVAINAEIVMQVLDMRDIEVDHAENGQMAVQMFSDSAPNHYDAVLMDIRMPLMDGLEATEHIRALDRPDARSVPVIALTANAFDEDVQRSLQAGMNAHLTKPVHPEILYQTLEELIWEKDCILEG